MSELRDCDEFQARPTGDLVEQGRGLSADCTWRMRGNERQTPHAQLEVAICNLKFGESCSVGDPKLRDAHFSVNSIDLLQSFADFAPGGIGADGVDNVGHGVDSGDVAIRAGGRSLGGGMF